MKQIASFWVCTLQCFLLVTLQVRCIPEADGTNPLPGSSAKRSKAPDGLVEAEKHALTGLDNRKLGIEEYLQPSKHLIPFDKNHFDFDEEDWSVYSLPQLKGEQMIVSVSPHVGKELTISTIIKPMSNIIISYQIHLTANGAPEMPTFSVYLITNGIKTLLKEETPQELWKTTSLSVHTKKLDSELLLVGTLNAQTNKIALRSFTVQDGVTPVHHRYGTVAKISESEDMLTGSDSHGDSFINENEPVFHSESFAHGLSKSDFHPTDISTSEHFTESSAHPTTIPSIDYNDNSSYSSYNESSLSGNDYVDFENGNIEEPIYDENATNIHFPLNVTGDNTSPPNTNISYPEFALTLSPPIETSNSSSSNYTGSISTETTEMESSSSIAKGVFNFFIVVIICSIVGIGYLFWRRRQNQKEDEIPVFSRTSTEHGNPTFSDSEINADSGSTGINRENQLNYRSIE